MKTLLALTLAFLPIRTFAQEPAAPAAPAEKKEAGAPDVKVITPDEAEKLLKETPGITILDVRTPEEFDHQHIKGAVNINVFDTEFEKQVLALDQTKPVILHCQSGRRSTQALEELGNKVKFPTIYHMNGGFKAWKDAKKPIESKPLPGAGRLAPGTKEKAGAAPAK
jgi:phage shock protein E